MTREERIKQLHRHIATAAVTAGAVVVLVAVGAVRGYSIPGISDKGSTASVSQETAAEENGTAASQTDNQISALTSSTVSAETSSSSGTASASVSESKAAAIANAVNPTTVQEEMKNTDLLIMRAISQRQSPTRRISGPERRSSMYRCSTSIRTQDRAVRCTGSMISLSTRRTHRMRPRRTFATTSRVLQTEAAPRAAILLWD